MNVHACEVRRHVAGQKNAERALSAVHGAKRQQGAEEAPRREHEQLPGAVAVEAAPRRALQCCAASKVGQCRCIGSMAWPTPPLCSLAAPHEAINVRFCRRRI